MILKFRNNSYPAGYFDIFEIDTELITLKPKEEITIGEWNGEKYDVNAELWEKVSIEFPVTENEAKDLYQIRKASEIYIDEVRYDLNEISDREALGTTEFRKMEISFISYTSTSQLFKDSSIVATFEITAGVNILYTDLQKSEVKPEQEQINWLKDIQTKFTTKKQIEYFRIYTTEEKAEAIKDTIYTGTITIQEGTDPAWSPIAIESVDLNQVGNDLIEVDIKVIRDELQYILTGDYNLVLFHSNTDKVPSTWATDRDSNGTITANSVFKPLNMFEKEDEESDITARKLIENTKFKDKLNWLSIHDSAEEAALIHKYINLVDTVVLFYENETVFITGEGDISLYTVGGGQVVFYNEILFPGMQFKVDGVTYTVLSMVTEHSASITPEPPEVIPNPDYTIQTKYEINYAEIGITKNDKGLFELEYDLIINEDIFYPYG